MRFAGNQFAAQVLGVRAARPGRFVPCGRFALPIISLAWLAMAPPAARAAERVSVWLPPASELAAEDARRDEAGLPWRFAMPQAVQLTPGRDGRWDRLPDGARRWRLEVASPGALSINLGFPVYWLPRGATLSLRPAAGDGPAVVFDDGDNADHGELWTPVVLGDALVIELLVPADAKVEPLLELGFINSGYRFFGDAPAAKSGLCNVDVVCSEGDAWRREIASVGLISIDGSFACTGAMVNNTAFDGKPYFLTANHCNIRGDLAPSVVIYWNYESPVCGQHGGGSLSQFTSGSTLRATWVTTDFTLLELGRAPDPAFGVIYAGWNRGDTLPTSAVGIHHPNTDEKSISFENDPLQLTSYLEVLVPGDNTHLRVVDWDLGTTERGSSGSPLFDSDHLVVGQLHGGYAECDIDASDWYGWLNRSWDGGGTNATQLAHWLDPGSTGAVTVPLLDPAASEFAVTPDAGVEVNGPAGGPFDPSSWDFALTNVGTMPAGFSAAVDQAWLIVTPPTGIVPAGGTSIVTVRLAAAATNLAARRHTATLTISNPGRGTNETREVTLDVLAETVTFVSVGPNPFSSNVTFAVTMPAPGDVIWRVHDLRGQLVRGPVALAGDLGQNDITWDGRDASGRRLASGSYVLSVTAGGQEFRTGLMCDR
jgi:lysyl endopeptidase